MPRHGFIASLLLIGSFVLLAMLTSIKTVAERRTFASDIRLILESSCQPCHFQGGKMYEKLPFDKPKTITKLGTKLFTRIKDEDQQRMIREFLSEHRTTWIRSRIRRLPYKPRVIRRVLLRYSLRCVRMPTLWSWFDGGKHARDENCAVLW